MANHRGDQEQQVRWRLLGPVQVRTDGGWTGVGAGKLRGLLAVLLTEPGRVVSTERLIAELWAGTDPPAGCRKLVSQYVFRLRRLMGDPAGRVLVTEPPGYRLAAVDDDVDAGRFAGQLAAAQAALARADAARAGDLAGQALGLWRGPALADVPRGPLAAAEAHRLDELRLDALELHAEAGLAQEQAGRLVAELRGLTARHPLRERFWLLLMRALEDSGRPAEALAAYAAARQAIADQLGADPGPDLQKLHHRLLARGPAQDAAPAQPDRSPTAALAGPRQLPGAVRSFTGRAGELRALSQLADGTDGYGGTVVISAISGTAGVGKTALAIHWAHQAAGRFPDGQLYVNLRGYDANQPVPAAHALAGFLRALGVPGRDIPQETDERAARYRSLLAGRRMLVLLDNAGSAEQVRPLLPGTPGCLILVTSRDTLAGLVARDGAARLDLDLLPPADAAALLTRLIGDRAAADPDATRALAAQCARLPLALRVAAELAASHSSGSLTELIAELADQQHRLERFEAGKDKQTDVRAVFSWSCQHLAPATARLFRLAGLHPGPDLDGYAAAALAGTTLDQANRTLRQLAHAHLIQPTRSGRYVLHDLLRVYARELASSQETEDERLAALTRLFDYYLGTAAAAMDILEPAERDQRPQVPRPAGPAPALPTAAAARDWLDSERAALVAAAAEAGADGWPGHATRLASTLYRYLGLGRYYDEARAMHSCARDAARRTGDGRAEAEALGHLGVLELQLDRYPECGERLREGLALCRETGDRFREALLLTNLGVLALMQGAYQRAAECHQQSLALFRELGDLAHAAQALSNLGVVDRRQGRYEQASARFREALAILLERSLYRPAAHALVRLGNVESQQGRYEQAIDYQEQACALFHEHLDREGEIGALVYLGAVHLRRGDSGRALDLHHRALAIARDIGSASLEGGALNAIGEIHLAIGQPGQARDAHESALGLLGLLGEKPQQARAHNGLGHAYRALGDPARARTHWQEALAHYTDLGEPEADQVRSQLASAGQAGVP